MPKTWRLAFQMKCDSALSARFPPFIYPLLQEGEF